MVNLDMYSSYTAVMDVSIKFNIMLITCVAPRIVVDVFVDVFSAQSNSCVNTRVDFITMLFHNRLCNKMQFLPVISFFTRGCV